MEGRPLQNVFYAPRVKNPEISLFIPMYNEQAILGSSVSALEKVLPRTGKEYEIILVDDNSKDNTLEIALALRKKNPRIGVAAYQDGPSRRENLAWSFPFARAPHVFMIDMDLSMNPEFIPIMVRKLEEGYSIVTASRYAPGGHVVRSTFRYTVSKIYNWFIRNYFKTRCFDNVCGFKGFHREAIVMLVNELSIDKSHDRGVFWDAEMLLRATMHGLPIYELPVTWIAGKKSELRFKREIRMIRYFTKMGRILAYERRTGRMRGLPINPLKIVQ